MSTEPDVREQTAREALHAVRDSLRDLIDDPDTPSTVRHALETEYTDLEALWQKLDSDELHVAVFGRVSVGKSSLLNALLADDAFATGPLHGVTTHADAHAWVRVGDSPVRVFDTPGIDEIDGETREQLARHVARRSDLVLFVCESDLTQLEQQALATLASTHRPLLLVLNKADRYTRGEREALLESLRRKAEGLVRPDHVLAAAADPRPEVVVRVTESGDEEEFERPRSPDIAALEQRIVDILQREGRVLAALNAGLFASEVSDAVAARVADIRRAAAKRVIRGYCLGKGLAVAVNPVPLTDLAAAAALDVSLVFHLSRIYGLPITRHEAGKLVAVISVQLAALMGAVWAVHAVSSLLKTVSAGLSVTVTALAQGSVAWYATYLIGEAATRYFVNGRSWGPGGPKRAVRDVLDLVDRDSILSEARRALAERLRGR
ncbi:GTP-binding protein [uncultured Abyssibacter sp.]|uniref:GTP-binding protein n=1 Tax=uncultured Abyssibacter sp. TaxID=2320202 RepID=UPI0032B1FBCE